MEELQELFGENALSYEDFTKAVEEKGMKLANLSAGGYVAKSKYDDDVKKAKGLDYKKKFEDLQASIEGDDGVYEKLNKNYLILDATNKVASSGIKPEFAKFVANEVLGLVTDTIDFDTALKSYKAKNPQYNTEATVIKKGTSVDLGGKSQSNENQTNSIMNDLIRSARD